MKAKIRVGYTDHVMDLDDAVAVTKALMNAEVWESKYLTSTESATGKSGYVYGAYRKENPDPVALELIPEETYRIAKLRGKPAK